MNGPNTEGILEAEFCMRNCLYTFESPSSSTKFHPQDPTCLVNSRGLVIQHTAQAIRNTVPSRLDGKDED